jgi:hypothetical protein
MTRKTGYGTLETLESSPKPTTATSNPKIMSSKCAGIAPCLYPPNAFPETARSEKVGV